VYYAARFISTHGRHIMQAVQCYLLKSVTVEIFIANFDLAENKKNGRTGVIEELHFLCVLV